MGTRYGCQTGSGAERVLSLPDGVAQTLGLYLSDTEEQFTAATAPREPLPMPIGDLSPDCGAAAMISEEGCRKCYSCGFSEC